MDAHPMPHPVTAMMLPARHYISDHTRFMRELMAKEPALAQQQQQGRAIWWDKPPADLALGREMDTGRVAQSAYVYQSR
jgi:hypothetical protein